MSVNWKADKNNVSCFYSDSYVTVNEFTRATHISMYQHK